MPYLSFRLLNSSDAGDLSELLISSPQEYIQYFHPFDFKTSTIRSILENNNKDKFFAIELKSETSETDDLIGFYMLRGMDQGYSEPMYGIYIAQEWQGMGIAKLSFFHAECFCKMKSYKKILLKVNPENIRAKKLYEYIGFKFLREDSRINNIVLYKDIAQSGLK